MDPVHDDFAAFAQKCGLNYYPDPDGGRYLYALADGTSCKKSEYAEFIDELWNALVRARGGDRKFLIGGADGDADEDDDPGVA